MSAPDKLIVARSENVARDLCRLLGLGDDWFAAGYGSALTGRGFNRVVIFDYRPGDPGIEQRREYVDRVVHGRLSPKAELAIL